MVQIANANTGPNWRFYNRQEAQQNQQSAGREASNLNGNPDASFQFEPVVREIGQAPGGSGGGSHDQGGSQVVPSATLVTQVKEKDYIKITALPSMNQF